MSQRIKTGYLRYYHKGLLSKKWKDYYFVLFNDSTLQWFEKQHDHKPEGTIRIRDIAQNLCVGPYTRCLPNRPQLPRSTDEANLIALPRSSMRHHDQEIIWILCNDVTHLNDWMKAIVSTLPPPPQQPPAAPQQQGAAFRPSAPSAPKAPPPYPTSNSYPRAQQAQQSLYPRLQGNQQPNYNPTRVVVQPSPTYVGGGGSNGYRRGVGGNTLAAAGLGLAGGALLGGALGYAWGDGFGGHGGWGYGMGPAGYYGGYGGWYDNNDTTIVNNYYDNDTTNNYNYADNQQTDYGGGSNDYGGGYNDYGGGSNDFGGGINDFGGGSNDFGGGINDFGGGDFGGNDFGGGGGDFSGGDFGGGGW